MKIGQFQGLSGLFALGNGQKAQKSDGADAGRFPPDFFEERERSSPTPVSEVYGDAGIGTKSEQVVGLLLVFRFLHHTVPHRFVARASLFFPPVGWWGLL
ncbi:hypothetical protein [Cereibacter azotoformans]|uniref:hypothetical protein n=1 Tax=Cereibacter azotoformans TaxID=43057 RepID=UPI001F4917FB|nr:hypothetical protein [Cereibacter azotoformans]